MAEVGLIDRGRGRLVFAPDGGIHVAWLAVDPASPIGDLLYARIAANGAVIEEVEPSLDNTQLVALDPSDENAILIALEHRMGNELTVYEGDGSQWVATAAGTAWWSIDQYGGGMVGDFVRLDGELGLIHPGFENYYVRVAGGAWIAEPFSPAFTDYATGAPVAGGVAVLESTGAGIGQFGWITLSTWTPGQLALVEMLPLSIAGTQLRWLDATPGSERFLASPQDAGPPSMSFPLTLITRGPAGWQDEQTPLTPPATWVFPVNDPRYAALSLSDGRIAIAMFRPPGADPFAPLHELRVALRDAGGTWSESTVVNDVVPAGHPPLVVAESACGRLLIAFAADDESAGATRVMVAEEQ